MIPRGQREHSVALDFLATKGRDVRSVDWHAPGVGLLKSEGQTDEEMRAITTLETVSCREGRGRD